MDKQVQYDIYTVEDSQQERQLSEQYYRTYRKAGHNIRTCQEDIDISSILDST